MGLKVGCSDFKVYGCATVCFSSLVVAADADITCSCFVVYCSMAAGGSSALCSVVSAGDFSPASLKRPVVFGRFGGALRLSRWMTSPEGRISLTRKSVYLCTLDMLANGRDQRAYLFFRMPLKPSNSGLTNSVMPQAASLL